MKKHDLSRWPLKAEDSDIRVVIETLFGGYAQSDLRRDETV